MRYDYIIAGAGSAGCVLANRLSADPATRVLLLEAGPEDRNIWLKIPLGFGKVLTNPRLNWCFESEAEPHAHDRREFLPRGKVLGGSSSINGMIYMRGQRSDYDMWAQMGCSGWSYDDVLPYFRKSEDNTRGSDPFHGTGGPLTVSDQSEITPISRAMIAAGQDMGLPFNRDFNGAAQDGIGLAQVTMRRGRRASTAEAFLKPARSRPNLDVQTRAQVARVMFTGKRASGIRYLQGGRTVEAQAGAAVILCGGVYGSPQMLELSGIGDADRLRDLGVAVVHHLPGVGEGLQDHQVFRLRWRLKGRPGTFNERTRGLRALAEGMRYVTTGRGVLASPTNPVNAFFRTRPDLATPDAHLQVFPGTYASMQDRRLDDHPGITLGPTLLRPESRGSVHARSADPRDAPAIRTNILGTTADCHAAVRAMKFARALMQTAPIQPFFHSEMLPGAEVRTDAEFEAFARETGGSNFHAGGSCRMGPAGDAMAVVDPRLRVRGVEGLLVVDASVMPQLVSGNTNAPTIMIAEKAADMLLQNARDSSNAA
ncbi:GMC family oxidoreductase [Pseudooceanicola aestuarii]|uniref:GMC family oxidoreductase n=1 Tax=Pseudooceanicola aestuarii TaxID=2697319 RepID=UPI0013D5F2DA|nr:GMC family oxidoreductase N-terminal domain-containing protein [Pseudooceanicola aestuarii]